MRAIVVTLALLLVSAAAVPAQAPVTATVGFTNAGAGAQDFVENPVLKAMPQLWAQAGVTIVPHGVSIAEIIPLTQTGDVVVGEGTGLGTVAVVGEKSPPGARNVRIFIGELQASPFELVVRDGVSGLAGVKVVGVASLDSASAQICQAILNNAGFVENRDYKLQVVGLTGERIKSVQSGAVDGTCEAMPYPEQYKEKFGLRVLGGMTAPSGGLLPFVAGAWVYNVPWARDPAHREILVRLAEGYLLGLRWTYDPANADKVTGMIEQSFSVSHPVAQEFYRRLVVDKMLSPDGYLPKATLDGVARVMAGTKTLDTTSASLAQYFDWTILRDAAARLKMPMRTPEY